MMTEIVRFPCPHCGRRIKVAAGFIGRQGNCPDCRSAFVVPSPDPAVTGVEAVAAEPRGDGLDDLARAVAHRSAPPGHLPGHPAPTSSVRPDRVPSSDLSGPPRPPPLPATQQSRPGAGRTAAGWVATVVLGAVWLRAAAPDGVPATAFLASLVVAGLSAAYLVAPGVRRAVDGWLAGVGRGTRWPSRRLLVVCGLAMAAAGPTLFADKGPEREVARLVEEAKRARAAGRIEEPTALAGRAMNVPGAQSDMATFGFFGDCRVELGRKKEPQVARLVADARTAVASGDRARAISLLTQATDWEFGAAPSQTEARELLKSLQGDGEIAVGGPGRTTPSPAGLGKSVADLKRDMPFLSDGTYSAKTAPDGTPEYRWDIGKFFTIHLFGPEDDVTGVFVTAGFPPTASARERETHIALIIRIIRFAADEADELGIARWLSDTLRGPGSAERRFGKMTVIVASTRIKGSLIMTVTVRR